MDKNLNQKLDQVRLQEFAARAQELAALEARFGPEVADTVLEVRAKSVEAEWSAIAKNHPRNDIQGLQETLWTWVAEAGFEFTHQRQGNTVRMHVTKCPLADMARRIGRAEWGYRCYCCDDPSIVRGFNPAIKFSRTKTLMQGHDCCDHTYEE